MKNNLIERYIYAVTRHLSPKIRADVEKELDGLISDMLEERCGDILPTEKDIKIVLLELGSPDELVEKYSDESQKALISGAYFIVYKRILKLVLPIVAVVMGIVTIISVITGTPDASVFIVFSLIGRTIGGVIAGVFQTFAIITFIFAVLDYKRAPLYDDDFITSLPEVPEKNEKIGISEPIVGIIMSIAVVIIFLGFPHILGFYSSDSGWVSVFNIDVLRSFWPFIILWAVLGIIDEGFKLMEGRYTKRLATVTTITSLLTLGCAAVIFLDGNIINIEFFPQLIAYIKGELPPPVMRGLGNVNLVMFGIVCFGVIIEIGTTCFKVWRYNK